MSELDDEIDRLVEEEAAREEEEFLELELELEEEELEEELEEQGLEEELEEQGLEEELEEAAEIAEERIQPPQLTVEEKRVLPVLPVYEMVREYVAAALAEASSTDDPELRFLFPGDLDLEEAVESYTNLVSSSLRYGTTYTLPIQRRVDFLISYLTDSM